MAGTRFYTHVSFLAYAIFVAPFAWYLLTVQRVPLPYHRIDLLNSAQPEYGCCIPTKINILIPSSMNLDQKNSRILENLFTEPDRLNHEASQCIDVETKVNNHDYQLGLDQGSKETDEYLQSKIMHQNSELPEYTLLIFFPRNVDQASFTFGKYRHGWLQIPASIASKEAKVLELIKDAAEILVNRILQPRLSLKSLVAQVGISYKLTFSLLNEDPGEKIVGWHFSDVSERFFKKFITKLSALADFSLESQEIHYARLSAAPPENDPLTGGKMWHVDEMKSLLSSNSFSTWSLSNRQREKALQFMLFVPMQQHLPLHLYSSHSSRSSGSLAFAIHGMGGVAIYNGLQNTTDELLSSPRVMLSASDLVQPMGAFVSQLRNIVGLPKLPKMQGNLKLELLSSPSEGITDWELDSLARAWLFHHLVASKKSLSDIVELLRKLPQIEVTRDVSEKANEALDLLQQSTDTCALDLYEALRLARHALNSAEEAYFDPTMVAQLYFAQDQLLAVYLPLIAPVAIPLILGIFSEFKRYKEKKKKKEISAGKQKEKQA